MEVVKQITQEQLEKVVNQQKDLQAKCSKKKFQFENIYNCIHLFLLVLLHKINKKLSVLF